MRNAGTLRVALAFVAFLSSLSLVIWRQSRAYELLGELDATRSRRAATESEKSGLITRIQHLESRSRVTQVAGSLWGMRVPEPNEQFVILVKPDLEERGDSPGPRMVRAGIVAGVAGVAELVRERE